MEETVTRDLWGWGEGVGAKQVAAQNGALETEGGKEGVQG